MRERGTPLSAGLAGVAIFAVALVLRLVYLHDVADVPFFVHPIVDARAYDAWALRIAEGDWLGDRAFYQAPAYPYFLALIYRVAGHDLWVAHCVQMVLGSLSCVLVFATTRVLFGFASALTAGLLMAVYAPAIFFDGVLGKQSLGMFLMTALLFLLVSFQRDERGARLVAAGAVLGLLALTRENALILVGAVPLWLWFRFRDAAAKRRALWLGGFAAGVAAVLVPVGLRNYVVGDTFMVTTSQLGTNFYYGNHEGATGSYVPLVSGRSTPDYESRDATRLAEEALGRSLTAGEVSDYWLTKGLDYVREHPLDWLRLNVKKTFMVWNAFEIADVEDVYVLAESSPLLAALLRVANFGVLVPLAVAGVVLLWPERRNVWLLYWLAFVFTAGVAIFLVLARFRYPLVPLLLPLAGAAIAVSIERIRQGRSRELLTAGGAALVALAIVNLPLVDEPRMRSAAYYNLGSISLADGDLESAERYFLRAEALAARDLDLQLGLAVLRLRQSRVQEAEVHARAALEILPRDHRPHRVLEQILLRLGRTDEARVHGRLARNLDPDAERSQGD